MWLSVVKIPLVRHVSDSCTRQWHAATNQHIVPGAPPLDPLSKGDRDALVIRAVGAVEPKRDSLQPLFTLLL